MAKIKVRYGESWETLENQYPGIKAANSGTRKPKAGMTLEAPNADRYDKMNATPSVSVPQLGGRSGGVNYQRGGTPLLATQTTSPTTTPTTNAPGSNRGGYGVQPIAPKLGGTTNVPSVVGNIVDRNRGADTAAAINAQNASTRAMMAASNNSALVKQAEIAVQNAIAEASAAAATNQKAKRSRYAEVVMIDPRTGKVTHNWKSAHGIKPRTKPVEVVQEVETSNDWLGATMTDQTLWRVAS